MTKNRTEEFERTKNDLNIPLKLIKNLTRYFSCEERYSRKKRKQDMKAAKLILRISKLSNVYYSHKHGKLIITPNKEQLEMYKKESGNEDYKYEKNYKRFLELMGKAMLENDKKI
jgi:hypothetical protein